MWRNSKQLAKRRLGADGGSDQELLIAKFRLKLKNVGKSNRQFRYDLNQIPYDNSVEMTNIFKGLDLIQFLKNHGWRIMTLYKEAVIKTIPKKKKCKKAKWLSEAGFQIGEKKKRS